MRENHQKENQENKTLLSQSINAKLSQMEEENRQERTHSNKKKKAVTLLLSLVILVSMIIGIISRG